MGNITEKDFERLVQSSAKKTNRNPDEIREKVRKFLTEDQGVTIGIPLEERVREAQVRAGEDVVIANLKRTLNGGQSISTETLFNQIRGAQVEAGEKVVTKGLRKRGLGKHSLRVVK